MKQILRLFCTTLFSTTSCLIAYANFDTSFIYQKTYGGTGEDYAYDMHIRPDGGYILGGVTSSFPAGVVVSCYVVRINAQGDTVWTTSYGATTSACDGQYINDICDNSDGGSIAVGGKTVCGNPAVGGEITRLDSNGNVLWTKYCSASADPYPVIQTADGNFIVGGYLTGLGAGGEEGFLMKLDANGDTIWSKNYGGAGDDWFYHILQAPDGGYIAAGKTTSFGQGLNDIYVIRTDANGNLLWSKTYGTALDEVAFGHCLQPTSDGGYILTGWGNNSTQSANGMFLLKIDSLGNMSWAKYYSGEYGHAVKQTADGGYAICGTGAYGATGGDVVLIKTDSLGNVQWSKTYGGAGAEQGLIMELANDGGYMVGGYTISFGAGAKDLYLVKTDSNGHSGCNESSPGLTATAASFIVANAATQVSEGPNTIAYTYYNVHGGSMKSTLCFSTYIVTAVNSTVTTSNDISVFPNPGNGVFTIKGSFGAADNEDATVEIKDMLGRVIYQGKVPVRSGNINEEVQLSHSIAKGTYLLSVRSGMENKVFYITVDR